MAGEMQSGAFFPLAVVPALRQGLFLLQLILETVTVFSTYLLLRDRGRSLVLTAGGVAFGLLGTIARPAPRVSNADLAAMPVTPQTYGEWNYAIAQSVNH